MSISESIHSGKFQVDEWKRTGMIPGSPRVCSRSIKMRSYPWIPVFAFVLLLAAFQGIVIPLGRGNVTVQP